MYKIYTVKNTLINGLPVIQHHVLFMARDIHRIIKQYKMLISSGINCTLIDEYYIDGKMHTDKIATFEQKISNRKLAFTEGAIDGQSKANALYFYEQSTRNEIDITYNEINNRVNERNNISSHYAGIGVTPLKRKRKKKHIA